MHSLLIVLGLILALQSYLMSVGLCTGYYCIEVVTPFKVLNAREIGIVNLEYSTS